jgi:hypothetical protein
MTFLRCFRARAQVKAIEEEEQEEEEGEEVVVMVVGVVEEEGIMTINKWLKGKAMVGGGQSRLR